MSSAGAKTAQDAAPGARLPAIGGVGKATLALLAKLGIARPFDLVLHLPLRYDDETRLYALNAAPLGEPVVVEGTVAKCEIQFRRGRQRQLACHIEDGSGVLTLRFYNFYESQVKQLAAGTRVRAFGEIRHARSGAEMAHPRYRVVREDAPVAQALTPVYPTTAKLGQDELRRLIARELADSALADTLPADLTERLGLPRFRDAVLLLHNPPPQVAQATLSGRTHPAWRRVKFDELLAQQLSMRVHHRRRQSASAPALKPRGRLAQALLARLPFKLTNAQNRALAQIRHDLAQPHPMQRLLQGDVGSGKTIVAALAALQCVENERQVAIMAPTEILAEQNYTKFSNWINSLGVEVSWLAGSLTARAKRAALARVAAGETAVVVGTHALFQKGVRFRNLALAIVDEQHRFGVEQRLALRKKGARSARGAQTHQLMMSATPIPRTLAMSYYADLDVSVIDEMPPGRGEVKTKLLLDTRRAEVIRRVRDACVDGGQAYWVCPLIEESEALQLKTALETYESVQKTFPELKIGLVHGRLKGEEKARVMSAFKDGAIQLLVATTVIEVGVDVPGANLMVIESAERMGLAQLHQLRGRIGRGAEAATCILLYANPLTPAGRDRLEVIYKHSDGFEIANEDLRLRGPGELLGARQSGVPMLRFADLNADLDLLAAARAAAETLLHERPDVAQAHLARWLGGRHEYLTA